MCVGGGGWADRDAMILAVRVQDRRRDGAGVRSVYDRRPAGFLDAMLMYVLRMGLSPVVR